MWAAVVFVVAVLSGATATVAGFGIGSLLTPLLALRVGVPTAVAAVALPHLLATALRGWRLRRSIDIGVLRRFGVPSVAGSLIGALLAGPVGTRGLTLVLGGLLLVTGIVALTGLGASWSTPRAAVAPLGAASGLFGGLAGNQGGMRAVALLHFRLSPQAFVATATACGLLVDAARVPVYLWRSGPTLQALWPLIGIAAIGTLIGTLIGERILLGLPPARFRRAVGAIVLAVGVVVVASAL
jgi:uncharacterized membrane protein YfcA